MNQDNHPHASTHLGFNAIIAIIAIIIVAVGRIRLWRDVDMRVLWLDGLFVVLGRRGQLPRVSSPLTMRWYLALVVVERVAKLVKALFDYLSSGVFFAREHVARRVLGRPSEEKAETHLHATVRSVVNACLSRRPTL